MWMVENEYDHNIRIRVENKAELFLREQQQVKKINIDDVRRSVGCLTEAERLYRNNKRFAGVTMYAEVSGMSLKDAKIYCDKHFA